MKTYRKASAIPWTALLSLLLFIVMLVAFVFGVQQMSTGSIDEQRRSTERAIRRAIVQCYALEGAYPRDINHLTERYGLVVDDTKFFVHYNITASNLFPDVTLFDKHKGGD